ncbi:flagellar hook-associated protein : Similar to flagellar hook-associated protein FlgK OS=Candidatus Kuenenia stuttgartiensis GN=flgK PE=4 SV=1: Flg_bb_rod [Gemmataceae bacterium]|nr:flagellar hook-associated protein : Similar to flagellar hook-associated protein FlgK OS=Candidatus Kuenenia stuttgartiensis GN=flgK PE=4 SV=1: Flg_bb_rod [Gemmataceae bacterium]VTT97924.1 flagellar hook-associated protein : Similar to flagellar hook-associated protein FlgK OS=Candidatus Kuenenia stuttgartiensis GN=flgK PE=4 SV=1: Flg_bb_rod [Gemmataceae bacterium]
MNAFPIGLSALGTAQRALDLIGQNVSNASTPGYHRQAANLVSRTAGGTIGTGVDIATLTRYETPPVRTAILTGNGGQGAVATRIDARRQIEASLRSGAGGVGDSLESFFNQAAQLTTRPEDAAVRRPFLAAAGDVARQFNAAAGDLDRLRTDLGAQVGEAVNQINAFATQIADLNSRIAISAQSGGQPNDLLDQRDQLVDQLSQRIDIRTTQQPFGVVNIVSSGAAVVVGEFANQFQAVPNGAGNIDITQAGVAGPVPVTSGRLGGLLQEYNQDLPATRARLDGLAAAFISRVNQVQATGLGTTGPQVVAAGTVSVTDPSQPLATQNLPFPIQAGQLTVSVSDTAAGTRTNTTVAIDPATQSLQDVATVLSGVPGLTASVDPASGTLQVSAQPGFAFDFAGRDTNPPSTGPVANSDTAGVLSGLGVGGLFTGTNATGVAVRTEIADDPRLLAASRSGQPGDASNFERLVAVRDQAAVSGRTLAADFTDLATGVGSTVTSLGDQQAALAGVQQNLFTQEQGVTGVDTNEELVRLLDFQRMIEGASKYLSVVNTALDSIMGILK